MKLQTIKFACILSLLQFMGCSQKGPEDPYLSHCSTILEASLRSPSTLKVIHVEHYSAGSNLVTIEYDAANAYGTPIRGKIMCEYPEVSGSEPPPAGSPLRASSLNAKRVTIGTDVLSDLSLAVSNSEATLKLLQKERGR